VAETIFPIDLAIAILVFVLLNDTDAAVKVATLSKKSEDPLKSSNAFLSCMRMWVHLDDTKPPASIRLHPPSSIYRLGDNFKFLITETIFSHFASLHGRLLLITEQDDCRSAPMGENVRVGPFGDILDKLASQAGEQSEGVERIIRGSSDLTGNMFCGPAVIGYLWHGKAIAPARYQEPSSALLPTTHAKKKTNGQDN
jgi:hypothetical protein